MRIRTVEELKQIAARLTEKADQISLHIKVCGGAGCRAAGSESLCDEFISKARQLGMRAEVSFSDCMEKGASVCIGKTGCQGLCQGAPLVSANGHLYTGVTSSNVETILAGGLNGAESSDLKPTDKSALSFYAKQTPFALLGCGDIYPDSLESYLASNGFTSFAAALTMEPSQIIAQVEQSGLRGRGGGGFLTGKKWRVCSQSTSLERFIVCNGDEGDPGAFMDCALMEGNPFRVLEGMMIGALAIGAQKGYVYVRNEYPVAVKRLRRAMSQLREAGLLGTHILGSGFSFDILLVRGGGAFVCGESSALMRSIEGKIGEPSSKYVRSTEKGLFGKPTVLNNVETFACIPGIVPDGYERFRALGTATSTGTKAFCLAGCVQNTGLVEVPMGITLREIVFGIGGGIRNNRPFKAVQTGGPSGGCLSEAHLDLQVDYEQLFAAGSMMGSGGMIVMDDRSCMVDVAKYFTEFLLKESCGKCVPCREGLYQLHTMLNAVSKGVASLRTLDEIDKLTRQISISALCGLGKSASNPVRSAITHFRSEFETHVTHRRCDAGVCKGLTTFVVDAETCSGCMRCKRVCPVNAIAGAARMAHSIDASLCIRCGACRLECPDDAVQVASRG